MRRRNWRVILDFKGVEKFGIEIMTPKTFLQMIGEI